MIYTLMLGAPVRSGDHQFGTVCRILVNNGVANQFTVSPSGLFGGPERIVPISDVVAATADGVTLECNETEWKAYGAFNLEKILVSDQAAAPSILQVAPGNEVTTEPEAVPTAEAGSKDRALENTTVALTNTTTVGDRGQLAGIVADTGIPQQLLVAGGGSVPFEQVGVLDEKHITLGQVGGRLDGATAVEDGRALPQRLDGATPPGTIGQERRHDQ